jgi:FK506-binding nuclear protein
MAAIDPTEAPEVDEKANGTTAPRATLKIVRTQSSDEDDEEDNEEYMRALLAESDSEEDSESEEEANGGPSDPAKSKKARKQAALEQLMESINNADSDEEMEGQGHK